MELDNNQGEHKKNVAMRYDHKTGKTEDKSQKVSGSIGGKFAKYIKTLPAILLLWLVVIFSIYALGIVITIATTVLIFGVVAAFFYYMGSRLLNFIKSIFK